MSKVNGNMDSWSKAFDTAGSNIDKNREALIKELKKDNPNEGEVLKLRANFDRSTRMFETLSELWKSVQQNMQRIIQNINIR
jgi:hypothetical protein